MRLPALMSVALLLFACKPSKEPVDEETEVGSVAKAVKETPDAKAQPKAKADTKAKPSAAPLPDPEAAVGKPAPQFELADLDGKTHKLSDYAGKTVVLEWFNPQCPFVNFAHDKGPLKAMAAKETAQGVVWLAINSGAPGKQGHGVEKNKTGVQKFSLSHPVLLDEDGSVGYTYGARKTPHMFVIDDKGVLVYAGAIDNAPFGEVDGGGDPVNHVAAALADLRGGKPVTQAETKAYGCTVKYDRS